MAEKPKFIWIERHRCPGMESSEEGVPTESPCYKRFLRKRVKVGITEDGRMLPIGCPDLIPSDPSIPFCDAGTTDTRSRCRYHLRNRGRMWCRGKKVVRDV